MLKKYFVLLILFCSVFCYGGEPVLLSDTSPSAVFCKEKTPYVYMSIIIKTGIGSEAGYNMGMGTFISKLFLVQTKNKSKEDIDRIFYSSGCSLSAQMNLDYLEIKVITLKDTFDDALNIIGECIAAPNITSENIENAKKVTLEKITEAYDTPFQRLYDTFRQNLYVSNPYKRNIYGTVQSVKNIDRKSVMEYFTENFQPNNITIAVLGDFDVSELCKKINQAFFLTRVAKTRKIYDYYEKFPKNKTVRYENYDKNDKMSYAAIGYLMPGVNHKDYFSALVLSAIIGEGKSSLVFRNIRQKYGIGYMIGFRYEQLRRQSHGYMYISALDDSGTKINKAKEEFLNIINDIKTGGVSEKELNKAKTYITEQYKIKNLDRTEKVHNMCFAAAICNDYRRYDDFEKNVREVTAKDVQKAAKKYFANYLEVNIN